MWNIISQLWVFIEIMLENVNSGTPRTVNNLVTTVEAHSENFKAISLVELEAKKNKALMMSEQMIAALTEATE